MSKILIISAVFNPEPIVSARISENLATELSKIHDVTVLCPQPTRPYGFQFKEKEIIADYKIVRLNSYTCPKYNPLGRLWESYSFGKHCIEYIKKEYTNINCIYINSWPLFAQYLIIRTALKFNIKTITHIQDIYPESLLKKIPLGQLISKILLPIDRYILKNSTSIIAISRKMKDYLVNTRKIDSNKVIIIHNWQDEESFIEYQKSKDKSEEKTSPFIFMYLGNNGPLAGVDLLIKSFVKAKILDSKLIIAGSGSKTEYSKQLAKSLNAKNIEFRAVPEGSVPQTQDTAHVMLLSMKKNGAKNSIPSKLPAYMFSSKPIIGSIDTDSDTANAIIESKCGIIVNPEDEDSLSEAMIKASQWNYQTLNEKGKSGYNYAIKNYSKTVNLNKLVQSIEFLI